MFWKAWESSFKKESMLKPFESTGISPFNPDIILNCFANQQQSRESSTSVLSGEDWRKIERLVRSEVKDQNSANAQRLAVQNQLLHHEIKDIKKSLKAKKKYKKCGKPLDLQQRKQYHGRAVFWSPSKTRKSRARQVVKEREEREEKLQKAEMKELKHANQLFKEKIAQGKRVACEAAKIVREREGCEGSR